MSDIKKTLEGYPDISFIENMTLESLQEQMIADFTEKYKEETGQELTLGLADPNRLVLYSAALQIYQGMQYITAFIIFREKAFCLCRKSENRQIMIFEIFIFRIPGEPRSIKRNTEKSGKSCNSNREIHCISCAE